MPACILHFEVDRYACHHTYIIPLRISNGHCRCSGELPELVHHMAATSKRQEFGVIKGQLMWSTRKELEIVLAQAGLGEWSPRLAAAVRHAMILEPGPFEEGADAPVGASRLGGRPDLPADVPWPWRPAIAVAYFKEHGERPWPMSFIAQIDFAEIHAAGGLEGFPSSGRLLFFCDPFRPAAALLGGPLPEELAAANLRSIRPVLG